MVTQVAAFLDAQPAPDSPFRGAPPSDAAVRGFAVFTKAGCNSCHAGEALTMNNFANVGTYADAPAAHQNGNGNGHHLGTRGYDNGHEWPDELRQGGVRILDEDVHVVIRTSGEIEREAVLAAASSARSRAE